MQQTMRTRLRERRRQKRLRLLRLFIYAAVIIGAFIGGWRYVHQPGFAFGQLVISGTNQINENDIIKMAGSNPPFNLFDVSAGRVQDALEHDIRFQHAETKYMWPGVLKVTVAEREPALYVANSYHSYLKLDYSGLVLNVTTGIPDAKAPLLIGEQCGNVYIGDKVSNEHVLKLLAFLDSIDGAAEDQIAEITVDGQGCVRVQLRAGFPIILGDAAQVQDKAAVFMTVFNEIKDKNIKAEYIDLTFDKPYIKLSGNNEGRSNERTN